LRFSRRWLCRKPSSGILRRVFLVRTDVSEERIGSIFRAGESRWKYSEQVSAGFLHILLSSIFTKCVILTNIIFVISWKEISQGSWICDILKFMIESYFWNKNSNLLGIVNMSPVFKQIILVLLSKVLTWLPCELNIIYIVC
jgi:hypothetical protein